MKEEVINRLNAALNGLASVAVYDETSCLNKGGAMNIIRETIAVLQKCEIVKLPDEDHKQGKVMQ